MRTLGPLALAGLLACAAPTADALEWATQRFEGEALPLQKQLQVAFAFKNTGARVVTIRDVQTNCDCLDAAADRASYRPGESGVVTATFTVGERYGLYERSVTIVTDEDVGPQRLTVRIEVPDPAIFTPRTLEWKIGSEARELATDLTVAAGISLSFTEVFASNARFRARLETLQPGRAFRLFVTPESTAAPANGAIRVKAQRPDGSEIVVSTYAHVR